ncbi:GMC oxidoreductase [Mycobacterium sp. NPDC003449]
MGDRTYDFAVVGSGPAGSAFARTILDTAPEASILMVEAGPHVTVPAGRHVRRTPDIADRGRAQIASQGPVRSKLGLPGARDVKPGAGGWLPVGIRPGTFLLSDGMTGTQRNDFPAASMSSNVGGQGSHWSCACPAPGEGELIPFLDRQAFDADLASSYRLLSVTQDAFDASELALGVRAALGERFDEILDRPVQAMPLALTPDSAGHLGLAGTEQIMAPLIAASDRFELRAETLAVEVLLADDRVTGLRLRDLRSGQESIIHAEHVFVAADAFRTPQLLHASGIRPVALGRYLNDHLDVRSFVQLDDRFRGLALGESDAVHGGLARDAGVNWIPYDRDVFPFSVQVMQLDASPIALDDMTAPWPGAHVGVVVFGCKELSADDRVSFADDETDAYGMPAIRVDYRLTGADLEMREAMFGASERVANALGEFVGGGPAILHPGGSYHYMGSVRMGPSDDGTSVCDPYGSVWGIDGLMVGGNGVIPTPTACNPTATSVALAIRSARHVTGGAVRRGDPSVSCGAN